MNWLTIVVLAQMCWSRGYAWGSDKVLLKDVSVLTLHQGRMTTGRRSSPVPQLKCIGGSAGCHKFVPQTVQCKNMGDDGYEVQWECKCDMDDSYRFGKVQVTCEGYDYPDDPYILKGSCGLEYTIDYTAAGQSRSQANYYPTWKSEESSGGWLFFFLLVCGIVFLICKMSGGSHENDAGHDHHHQPRSHNAPPPYGFKPEYTQTGSGYAPPPPTYADATRSAHSASSTSTSVPGGFWTGLGLGSIGGYLFGNRQRNNYYGGWGNRGWGSGWCNNGGWGSSWGNNGGWGSSWGNNRGYGSSWSSSSTTYRRSTGGSSSGTSRTASGYGGTSRR